MKIYKFSDLENDIAAKSAYLEKQRELITLERIQLKRAWIDNITSPPAMLLSLSMGFVAGYFRKTKANVKQRPPGKFSKARAGLQSAAIDAIKRFSSGVIIGIISSLSAQKGGTLSPISLHEE